MTTFCVHRSEWERGKRINIKRDVHYFSVLFVYFEIYVHSLMWSEHGDDYSIAIIKIGNLAREKDSNVIKLQAVYCGKFWSEFTAKIENLSFKFLKFQIKLIL